MTIEDRLHNWAWYVTRWLPDGAPEHPVCKSAEKNYIPDLGSLYDEDVEDKLEPDVRDGEKVELAMKELPPQLKSVIKATYISNSYCTSYSIANYLRMNHNRYQTDLANAKKRLSSILSRFDREKTL